MPHRLWCGTTFTLQGRVINKSPPVQVLFASPNLIQVLYCFLVFFFSLFRIDPTRSHDSVYPWLSLRSTTNVSSLDTVDHHVASWLHPFHTGCPSLGDHIDANFTEVLILFTSWTCDFRTTISFNYFLFNLLLYYCHTNLLLTITNTLKKDLSILVQSFTICAYTYHWFFQHSVIHFYLYRRQI